MKAAAIADEARRRNDEAVRRLRDESQRRIARRRAGMSSCMLGSMVAMLLFVTLEARRIFWCAASIHGKARAAVACEQFRRREGEIMATRQEQLASAFDAEEVRRIKVRSCDAWQTARRLALAEGCEASPLSTVEPPEQPERPNVFPVSAIWHVD